MTTRELMIEKAYTILQGYLDAEDFKKAFKLAGVIMTLEDGGDLQIMNAILAQKATGMQLDVYVEQEENEVDVISDEGVTIEQRKGTID